MSALDEDWDFKLFSAFRLLVKEWELTDCEVGSLLGVSEQALERWKATGRPCLSTEQRDRVSHLADIYVTLSSIFNDTPLSRDWLRRPNAEFQEQTPLDVLLDPLSGVPRVRAYLENLR